MRGVIADVHPGLVELADLIGGSRKPGSVIRPVITKNVRDHVEALERGQDRPDVVDVAVVDRDDHRLGGQRVALVQRVEQLRLVNRVVAVRRAAPRARRRTSTGSTLRSVMSDGAAAEQPGGR